MTRNLRALKKLGKKCNTAQTEPAGGTVAEVIDSIAENFDITGEKGDTGVSVTAIALETTEGAVTGGTVTFSDGTTADITVTENGGE